MTTEVNTLQAWLRLQVLLSFEGRNWALTSLALIYERLILFKLSRLSLLLAHCRISASFSTSFYEPEWAPLVLLINSRGINTRGKAFLTLLTVDVLPHVSFCLCQRVLKKLFRSSHCQSEAQEIGGKICPAACTFDNLNAFSFFMHWSPGKTLHLLQYAWQLW